MPGRTAYQYPRRLDNGPRVYYTDAFTDGEFGMFRADASGAPSAPGAPSPSSSGSVPTGSVRELEIDISTAEVVIQPGDAYDLQVSGSPRYEVQGLRRGVDD